MVGIIIALDRELEPYLKHNTLSATEYGGKLFYTGKVSGTDSVICYSGVGKVNAAYATTLMIERYKPDYIINTGTSGGLTRSGVSDIIVAESIVQHDMDTTAIGDPLGLVGTPVQKIFFETDEKLSKLFLERIKGAKKGIIACGDVFVADKSRAEAIVNTFNASACDMESGAVAQVCFMARLPFVVIRGVTDVADGGENSFFEMLARVSDTVYGAVVDVLSAGGR